jgi:hypothetical protein
VADAGSRDVGGGGSASVLIVVKLGHDHGLKALIMGEVSHERGLSPLVGMGNDHGL